MNGISPYVTLVKFGQLFNMSYYAVITIVDQVVAGVAAYAAAAMLMIIKSKYGTDVYS